MPRPFCRLTMTFAPPLDPRDEPDDTRLRDAVRTSLARLEARCDAAEATLAAAAACRGDAPPPLQ